MKKTGVTILMLLLLTGHTLAQQKTIQERLGYSRETRTQWISPARFPGGGMHYV
ncbi:MAG: hypothetical protein ABJA71_01710 [Ginsengibacter sp.]